MSSKPTSGKETPMVKENPFLGDSKGSEMKSVQIVVG